MSRLHVIFGNLAFIQAWKGVYDVGWKARGMADR